VAAAAVLLADVLATASAAVAERLAHPGARAAGYVVVDIHGLQAVAAGRFLAADARVSMADELRLQDAPRLPTPRFQEEI